MPDICSCGTRLVEDALFCHRCGKPQRELFTSGAGEPSAPPVLPPPPPDTLPAAVSFNNALVVRLCFLVASVASVLDAMPVLQLFCVVWSVTAGFVAVVLYRRATALPVSIREGVKMGWIVGVLNSLILTVLTTVTVAANSTELNALFREQVRVKASNDPATLAMVDNPYFLVSGILFMLLLLFIFVTGAAVAGGALSARILRDDHAPRHQPR